MIYVVYYNTWGQLEEMVCSHHEPIYCIEDLKKIIVKFSKEFPQNSINEAIDRWRPPLRLIIEAEVGIIEQKLK